MANNCEYGLPPTTEIRLVLLGKTGNGKSRTGNSILGITDPSNTERFVFGRDSQSVTSTCKWKTATRFGKKIDVVDTPGVFDTNRSNIDVQGEIMKCIALTTPGIHAIILCVQVGRFTQEDIEAVNHFVKYFGEELYKYAVVVFTQIDRWEKDQEAKGCELLSKDEYVKNLPEEIRKFLVACGNRYVFFNNRLTGAKQEDQVRRLLDVIDGMNKANNAAFYTDDMYKKAEKLLEEEMKKNQKERDAAKTSSKFLELLYKFLDIVKKVVIKLI